MPPFYRAHRGRGAAGRHRVPAATAAGVVDRLWSFDNLFNELLMYA